MRTLLLSISFLLISFLNYSQNSKIKYGVQAGLNYSTLYGYDVPKEFIPFYSESPAFAFLGGINFEYKIKEQLSLKLELNYERISQKAENHVEINNVDPDITSFDFTSKRNYDYLVFPILLKYSFSDKNSFYANGGIFLGYLLKSNLTNNLEANDGINNESIETTSNNNKTNFGVAIGLGKTIEVNERNSIFIEIRENLGLTNTSKNKFWENEEVKTNSLNLIIGYQFN